MGRVGDGELFKDAAAEIVGDDEDGGVFCFVEEGE